MKIAIMCFNFRWQAGGVRLIYSEAQALRKTGHHVVIYAPDYNSEVYPALQENLKIKVIDFNGKLFWQYSSEKLLSRIVEKFKHVRRLRMLGIAAATSLDRDFEIINLHDFSYVAAPYIKKRIPNAKIIWTMNEPPYQYLPKESLIYDSLSRLYNFSKDFLDRKYFRSIDGAVILTSRYAKWLSDRGIRSRVIWSGLDVNKFLSPVRQIKSKKTITLLGVGALNRYRRFEDIVLAGKYLRAKGVDTYVKILCKNIWKEDVYKKQLIEFIRENKMEDFTNLNFEGVSENELPKTYASADFFVLPMYVPPPRSGYGWQLVGFEAMAAGTPTIVCRAIDVVEALRDGETAIFVDPLNPRQIAERIYSMIKNPDLYEKIARNAQDFIKENMSWGKYVRDLLEFSAKI